MRGEEGIVKLGNVAELANWQRRELHANVCFHILLKMHVCVCVAYEREKENERR